MLLYLKISTGVVQLSPSLVAPVCQVGDQLELTYNTISGTTIDHRWEFTIFPENVTHTPRPVSAIGVSGIPPPLTVNPVSSALSGTVVKCIDVDMDSVAITTINTIGGE